MKKIISSAFISVFVVGCVSAPALRVSDAEGVESVSALGMTCA